MLRKASGWEETETGPAAMPGELDVPGQNAKVQSMPKSLMLETLENTLAQAPIGLDQAPAWRARARTLETEWSQTAARLGDTRLEARQLDQIGALVPAVLTLIMAHPSVVPGHGSGHARRVTAYAIILARAERLGRADAARLVLAAATHDLGRLALTEDSGALRHAEVSGVLFEALAPALEDLPRSFVQPTQHAILVHTAASPDETLPFRVINDVRTCDGLDCNGAGTGLVRALLHGSSYVGYEPIVPGGIGEARSWLSWWAAISRTPDLSCMTPPSPWGRMTRTGRIEDARALLAAANDLAGDPDSLDLVLTRVATLVEPDVPAEQIDQIGARLRDSGDREAARWSGLLVAAESVVARELEWLGAELRAAVDEGDDLLAPLAKTLLQSDVSGPPV